MCYWKTLAQRAQRWRREQQISQVIGPNHQDAESGGACPGSGVVGGLKTGRQVSEGSKQSQAQAMARSRGHRRVSGRYDPIYRADLARSLLPLGIHLFQSWDDDAPVIVRSDEGTGGGTQRGTKLRFAQKTDNSVRKGNRIVVIH